MNITKELSELGLYNIKIEEDNKIFEMIFCGNGDLYWHLNNKNDNKSSIQKFIITKENYELFSLFTNLFYNLENINIYKPFDFDLTLCENYEEKNKLYQEAKIANERLKNRREYYELYHDGIITWKSDDSFDEERYNEVMIANNKDSFKLTFTFKEKWTRSIRFRNSGSSYQPFNILFMDTFNKLQEYDPNYLQMHLEEYAYQKKLKIH